MPKPSRQIHHEELECLLSTTNPLTSTNDDKSTTKKLTLTQKQAKAYKLVEGAGTYYFTTINSAPGYKKDKYGESLPIQTSYRITAAISELYCKLIPGKCSLHQLVTNKAGLVIGHISKEISAFQTSSSDKESEYYEGDGTHVESFHLTLTFAATLAACWLLEEDDWTELNRRGPFKIDHDRSLISLLVKTGVILDTRGDYTNCSTWYAVNKENYDKFPVFDELPNYQYRGWLGDALRGAGYSDKLNENPINKRAFMAAMEEVCVAFSHITNPDLQSLFSKHIERGFSYGSENSLFDTIVAHVYERIQHTQELLKKHVLRDAKHQDPKKGRLHLAESNSPLTKTASYPSFFAPEPLKQKLHAGQPHAGYQLDLSLGHTPRPG